MRDNCTVEFSHRRRLLTLLAGLMPSAVPGLLDHGCFLGAVTAVVNGLWMGGLATSPAPAAPPDPGTGLLATAAAHTLGAALATCLLLLMVHAARWQQWMLLALLAGFSGLSIVFSCHSLLLVVLLVGLVQAGAHGRVAAATLESGLDMVVLALCMHSLQDCVTLLANLIALSTSGQAAWQGIPDPRLAPPILWVAAWFGITLAATRATMLTARWAHSAAERWAE